jgi:hypothetical protein
MILMVIIKKNFFVNFNLSLIDNDKINLINMIKSQLNTLKMTLLLI